MKIGVLTFHSQLNYGGVLQAVASYAYLKKQGYDAVVVDRWLDRANIALWGIFAPRSLKSFLLGWVRLFVRQCIFGGDVRHSRRIFRTVCFIQKNLIRTKRHFYRWEELEREELEFDALYVGSDQVWSYTWQSPAVYLLEGLRRKIPALSYAASIGRTSIPDEYKALYRRGLARFSAISVREKSAKKLIENLLTAKNNVIASEAKQSQPSNKPIMHVVDPVLLVERADWERIADVTPREDDVIFSYILRESLADVLPKIIAWSKKHKVKVAVYPNGPYLPFSFRRPIRSFVQAWRLNFKLLFSRVSVKLSAGPAEFVRGVARAKGVITDSFHATMFSAIFDKNVRVIRPNNETAAEMFSRMDEFAAAYTSGDMFADTLDDAFKKILESPRTLRYDYAKLGKWQSSSRAWLFRAIDSL